VVIDALLGIQALGPLRGILARSVAKLQPGALAREIFFLRTGRSFDLPPGSPAYETGKMRRRNRDAAVVADVTLRFGFAKRRCLGVKCPALRWRRGPPRSRALEPEKAQVPPRDSGAGGTRTGHALLPDARSGAQNAFSVRRVIVRG